MGLSTTDADIVDRIEQLGLSGDSARILDVLPLVHVAWADGRVQKAERAAVLAVLEARGIPPKSDAWLLIEALLMMKPRCVPTWPAPLHCEHFSGRVPGRAPLPPALLATWDVRRRSGSASDPVDSRSILRPRMGALRGTVDLERADSSGSRNVESSDVR